MKSRAAWRGVVFIPGTRTVSLGVMVASMALTMCDDARSHIWSAHLYEPSRDCLEPGSGVDVVSGPPVSTPCEPACVAISGSAYVSTVCPPYPPLAVIDDGGTVPSCAPALAAFARHDICNPDGGSLNPVDAGAGDASGGGDANGGDATGE